MTVGEYRELVAMAITNVVMGEVSGEPMRYSYQRVEFVDGQIIMTPEEIAYFRSSNVDVSDVGQVPNGEGSSFDRQVALEEGFNAISNDNLENVLEGVGELNAAEIEALVGLIFKGLALGKFDVRFRDGEAPLVVTQDGEQLNLAEALSFSVNYSRIGGIVGNAIGRMIGSNTLEDIALGTVFEVIGQRLGSALNAAVHDTATQVAFATGQSLSDQLEASLQSAGVGAVSSLLSAELVNSLGVDGVAGEALTTTTSTVVGIVSNNAIELARGTAGYTSLWQGLDFDSLFGVQGSGTTASVGAMSGAIGSFLGAKLGSLVVQPTTQAGALLSSVGSSIGSFVVGSAFATASASIAATGAASGIIGTASSALISAFGQTAANIIAPGVGAFIGYVLGALIGNLFGAKPPPPPQADAETVLNLKTGYYELGSINQRDGGNVELVRDMAESGRDMLNGMISLITNDSRFADNANTYSPTQTYGHTASQIWVKLGSSKRNYDTSDEAVEAGFLWAIERTKVVGGNIFMKRIIANNAHDQVTTMFGDMSIAEDYAEYQRRRGYVNDLMTNHATTPDGASWIITLQRAAELNLDRTSRSDFYGGFAGFADSLQILNLTPEALTYEGIGLTVSGDDITVRWDQDGNGLVPTNDPDYAPTLFQLDDVGRGGLYKRSTGGVNAGRATGRSAAIAAANPSGNNVRNIQANYVSGSGRGTSTGDDLMVHTSSSGITLDDRHTETWDVSWMYDLTYGEPDFNQRRVTVTIEGGNDVFLTGGGNDVLRGRRGNDWLDAKGGNDLLDGGDGDDVLFGRDGKDTLRGGAGDDYLSTGAGDDYDYNGNNEGAYGGTGNDTLVAGGGQDYLWGEDGDDVLILADGSQGWSRYNGGNGHDILSFERRSQAANITLVASGWHKNFIDNQNYANIEGLRGSVLNDRLYGNASANTLQGLAGDDTLSASGGRDTIEGGAGADLLSGGGDWDTVSYASSTAAVWVDLTSREAFGGHAQGDTFLYHSNGRADVEYFEGSDFADTFKGNVGQHNQFWGGKGDDWFVATAGNERYRGEEGFDTVDYSEFANGVAVQLADGGHNSVYANGTHYTNHLYDIEHVVGTNHADWFYGRGSTDDTFTGGRGNDHLYGYSGNDTYVYNRGDGNDTIYETADGGGWDQLVLGGDIAWGDLWFGRPSGTNTLQVKINGSSSATIAVGGHFHNDYNEGGIDAIDVHGTGAVYINDLTWIVNGSDSSAWVQGSSNKRDLLMGNDGGDRIFSNRAASGGNATNHETNGNILIGGRGNDKLYASVGDDTYVFERGDGADIVYDKGGEDRIQFGAGIRAEDVIFERVGDHLYIGVRDGDDAEDIRATQTADRIRIDRGAHQASTIEYVTAGGVDINLLTLDGIDWASGGSNGGSNPPNGGGGTNPPSGGGGGNPPSGGGGGTNPPYGGGGGGTHLPPILFDLDGDGAASLIGVDQSTVGVGGSATRLGWFGPEDGVLALDRNGDGVIDRSSEISFKSDLEGALTDMEGLRAYDTDGDGAFSATDDAWATFSVWQDLDGNGRSSDGELRTLDEVGITSISLELEATGGRYDNAADSVVLNTASATLSGGETMTVFDTALALAGPLTDADLAGPLRFTEIGALDLGPIVIEAADVLRKSFKVFAFDLAGNGFDETGVEQSALGFDVNGDGLRDRVSWVTSDDGFLVTDTDGDGVIDVSDLKQTHKTLEGKLLRGNTVRKLKDLGPDYMVWRDDDQDGIAAEGELFSLDKFDDNSIARDMFQRIRDARHGDGEMPIQSRRIEWFKSLSERQAERRERRANEEAEAPQSNAAQRLDALRAAEAQAEAGAATNGGDADGPVGSGKPVAVGVAAGSAAAAGTVGGQGVDDASALSLNTDRSGASAFTTEASDRNPFDGGAPTTRTASTRRLVQSDAWWLADLQGQQTLGADRTSRLGALLSSLDAEKAGTDDLAPQVLPQADREALAEQQRLLQAMAAFHGSSGAAGMQSPGKDGVCQGAMERLGVSPKGSISQNAFL